MKDNNIFAEITKKSSKTFYNASLLFPKHIREDVFILYSFVRIADDLIDSKPSKIREFKKYTIDTKKAFNGEPIKNIFIESFVELMKRKHISYTLIDDFFTAQYLDSTKKSYKNYKELLEFIYGVAEVIGLLMAHVMELPKKSYSSARTLGRAMQLVNILRDIEEDSLLGRTYVPQNELDLFQLPKVITADIAKKNPKEFSSLIKFQCERIFSLLNEARDGFDFIPKSLRLPIQVSADLYFQTTKRIEKNAFLIFEKKVKPTKLHIAQSILKNYIFSFYT